MGLDMYLNATTHLTNWTEPKDKIAELRTAAEACGLPPDNAGDGNYGMIEVTVHAGYWRKANQIHAWFVANVQGGEDECNRFEVSREQLTQLRDTCQQVLDSLRVVDGPVETHQEVRDGQLVSVTEPGRVIENPALAQELLPTQSGFFFGNTAYDEWYVKDLQHTIKVVEVCLACPDHVEFNYRSSW